MGPGFHVEISLNHSSTCSLRQGLLSVKPRTRLYSKPSCSGESPVPAFSGWSYGEGGMSAQHLYPTLRSKLQSACSRVLSLQRHLGKRFLLKLQKSRSQQMSAECMCVSGRRRDQTAGLCEAAHQHALPEKSPGDSYPQVLIATTIH